MSEQDSGAKHYLIFERGAHSMIVFVRATNATEAILKYILQNYGAELQLDGTLAEDFHNDGGTNHYPHPLAYIEALHKVHNEWQIREMPDWVWENEYEEPFCGESDDGPASMIDDCRAAFKQEFPRARAKAFVWYLKRGVLVTFYRKMKNYQIQILKRYFWDWDGHKLTVEPWEGSYEEIMDLLSLVPYRITRK